MRPSVDHQERHSTIERTKHDIARRLIKGRSSLKTSATLLQRIRVMLEKMGVLKQVNAALASTIDYADLFCTKPFSETVAASRPLLLSLDAEKFLSVCSCLWQSVDGQISDYRGILGCLGRVSLIMSNSAPHFTEPVVAGSSNQHP
ncbi:hypothetical protein PM082_013892 [Marasmius tenuissimus]|nr:hypothetical protein PM082_013892 [Marasmius tenuissimus]